MGGFVEHMAGKLSLFLAPLAEAMERMIAALMRAVRGFLLRLLGGVPAEVVQAKTAAALAQRPAIELTRRRARPVREADSPAPAPRPMEQVVGALSPHPLKADSGHWSDRVVRQCLERLADGEQPFPHLMRKLPLDVAAWISGMDIQDAADLARSHGTALKAAFEAWKKPLAPAREAGAEPWPAAKPKPEIEAESKSSGPRPRF